MFVRLKFGAFAGEVQFIRSDVARTLIAQHRATDTRLEEFADGGVVEGVPPVLVGERVSTVQKLKSATSKVVRRRAQ